SCSPRFQQQLIEYRSEYLFDAPPEQRQEAERRDGHNDNLSPAGIRPATTLALDVCAIGAAAPPGGLEPSLATSYRQGFPFPRQTAPLADKRVDNPVEAHVRNPCGPDATGAPRDPTPGQAEDRDDRPEFQRVLDMRSGERDARQNRRRPEAEHRSQRGQEKSTKDELLVEVREEIGRSNPWIELGRMNCTWPHAGENAERRDGANASTEQAPDHD